MNQEIRAPVVSLNTHCPEACFASNPNPFRGWKHVGYSSLVGSKQISSSRTLLRTLRAASYARQTLHPIIARHGMPVSLGNHLKQCDDVDEYSVHIDRIGKIRDWSHALLLLKKMQAAQSTPTVKIFDTVISTCGAARKWQWAMSVLEDMCAAGVSANVNSFNLAISACAKGHSCQPVKSLLEKMRTMGVPPNAQSYLNAISAYGKCDEWQLALSLLQEMRITGVMPNAPIFTTAISACRKAGQWECALSLLEEMRTQGLTQKNKFMFQQIKAACTPGQSQSAPLLLDEMRTEELPRSYVINVTEEHPNVAQTCLHHVRHAYRYEEHYGLSRHTINAFAEARDFVQSFYNAENVEDGTNFSVVLDSGCGSGESTIILATRYPNMPVIGVDRSLKRVSKMDEGKLPPNALLLRADLIDFWLLAFREPAWIVSKHFLLYPNPYPKGKDLKRRFTGHPILPFVVALGGEIVLRSNWEVYLREFHTALKSIAMLPSAHLIAFRHSVEASVAEISVAPGEAPLTNFERKYAAEGVQLYELKAELGRRDALQRQHLLQNIAVEAEVVLDQKKKEVQAVHNQTQNVDMKE